MSSTPLTTQECPAGDRIGGVFVCGHTPWRREKDLVGVGLRMLLMMQASLDAWGRVGFVFLDREYGARPLEEIDVFKSWIAGKLRGNFTIDIIPMSDYEPSWIPKRLRGYFLSWPLGIPSDSTLLPLVKVLRRQEAGRIFCHRIATFRLVYQAIKRMGSKYALVLDLDDVEHSAYARRLHDGPNYPTRFLLHLHTFRYWLWEQIALSRCVTLIVCSDLDATSLRKRSLKASVDVVPNSVAGPVNFRALDRHHYTPRLLFVGQLRYSPNFQGLNWFIRCIWPKVLERHPGARLQVVGNGKELINVPDSLKHSVDLLGFVENLEVIYAQSTLSICPIRSGGGTRVKLIEASAHGLASVSTSIGAEGLVLQQNVSIIIQDEPEAFAQAVIDLIDDPSKASKIGAEARKVFETHYARNSVISRAASLLQLTA